MGKKASSWVWKEKGGFFVKLADGKARCEYRPVTDEGEGDICGHVLSIHTRNMASHLATHGEDEEMWATRQSEKMQKGAFASFVSGRIILSAEELKQQQALLAVALCNDLKPITTFDRKAPHLLHQGVAEGEELSPTVDVERWDMFSFLSHLVPQFKPGFHVTLQARATDIQNLMDADIKFLLSRMIGVGFTTDGFTSDESKMHFHSLTAHGVICLNKRLTFLSFLLADRVFPEGTAEVVSSFILSELDEVWGVSEGMRVGMAIDGAELAMARLTKIPYWHCPAHWINLCIHDVFQWPKRNNLKVSLESLVEYPLFLRGIWDVIDKAKRTVTFFSTPKQWAELKRVADKSKRELKTMKQDVETRWSSEYLLLESVIESKEVQTEFWRTRNNREGKQLSDADFDFVDDILYILSCPHRITMDLQKWTYPCGVLVWPNFFRCITFWTVNCKNVITRALSKEVVAHLMEAAFRRATSFFGSDRRLHLAIMGLHPYTWQTHGESFVLATLVDANLYYFQQLIADLQSGKHFIDLIFDNMKGCIIQYAPSTIEGCCWGLYTRPSLHEGSAAQPTAASIQEPLYKRAKADLNDLWSTGMASMHGATGFAMSITDEIKLFYRRLGELQHISDILSVYQTFIQQRECPRCVHVALRFMAIPGANAPSECVFSDTGFVTSGRRAHTGAEWAEQQVRIHRNYDVVKKVRELVDAQPGQSLETAWKHIHGE